MERVRRAAQVAHDGPRRLVLTTRAEGHLHGRDDLGVARISVGGAFAFAALAGLVDAATELRDEGTYGYLARSAAGRASAGKAFED